MLAVSASFTLGYTAPMARPAVQARASVTQMADISAFDNIWGIEAKTDIFNKWLQKRWNGSTKLSNKNVRHSWCIRSIFDPKFSDGQAARSAGHALALHTSTYANAIEKRDMEEQAKLLR